jgi:transcriptional regulator with XRE-family HTH domain
MDHPLIRWRQRHRLTQQELAFQCELTQSVISACERLAKVPTGKTLAKILTVTGLPAEAVANPTQFLSDHPDFLGGPPPEQPPLGRPRHRLSPTD